MRPRFLKPDILLQETVRADHEVERARRQSSGDLLLLLAGAEAGEHRDLDGKALEPQAERVKVLLDENGGRREHSDLLARAHRLECGAQRDLGLAVADVAADEAVHRLRLFHVGLDLVDAAQLVHGLLVLETRFELGLPVGVRGKTEALLGLAPGVQLDEPVGEIADRRLDLFFPSLPGLAADLVELDLAAVGGDVLLDEVDLLDGDVDDLALGVFKLDVVALVAERRETHDPFEPPDAVVDVDDVVPGVEVDERVDRAAGGFLHRAGDAPLAAKDLALLDGADLDVREHEPLRQRVRKDLDGQVLEDGLETVGLGLVHREYADLVPALDEVGDFFAEVREVPEKGARRLAAKVDRAVAATPDHRKDDPPAARQLGVVEKDLSGPGDQELAGDCLPVELQVLPADRGRGALHALVVDDPGHRLGAEVVEDRARLAVEERVPVLAAPAVGLAPQALGRRGRRIEGRPGGGEGGGEPVERRVAHLGFAHGREHHPRYPARRGLRERVEPADFCDLVKIQQEAHGLRGARRVHVDDLAPDGELPVDRDARDPQVPEGAQAALEVSGIERGPGGKREDPGRRGPGRRQRGEHRPQRRDDNRRPAVEERCENGGPLGKDRGGRRRLPVRKGAPPGKMEHR
jgi:hypothetical protein